jgi:hypothetical protein
MKWLIEQDVNDFLNKNDYDIRKTKNARWIDQKCTADVITLVSDCVIEFINGDTEKMFWRGDIQWFEYTVQNVKDIFKKPGTDEPLAENEYDKFFAQPLELLAYAGILEKIKIKRKNFYTVVNFDLLSFLALREKNSLVFLKNYIEKVLNDSGILVEFEKFFEIQTSEAYDKVKNTFTRFTIRNTLINGETECFRIFTKVLNPLAYYRNKQGTESGRLSQHKITYDMLMYNRDNFRDIYANKPKDKTRKQYAEEIGMSLNSNYTKYLAQKAKRTIKVFNDTYRNGRTEVYAKNHINDIATHMHHIFSEAKYEIISDYLENIIALTPTQHLNYAHPLGNTQIIDQAYQHICLMAKSEHIQENFTDGKVEIIYNFAKFMFVLYIGLDKEVFNDIEDMDFDSTIREINLCYA